MFYKTIFEYVFLWFVGGSLYYFIEVLFRGYSHWTMFALGGICMMFFAFQGKVSCFREVLWKQVIRCAVFVTSCEFITGMIVNKYFQWNVWDYSEQPFHILGQVCLPFMVLFAILCVAGILLSGYLLHYFFGEEKPYYRVL